MHCYYVKIKSSKFTSPGTKFEENSDLFKINASRKGDFKNIKGKIICGFEKKPRE